MRASEYKRALQFPTPICRGTHLNTEELEEWRLNPIWKATTDVILDKVPP